MDTSNSHTVNIIGSTLIDVAGNYNSYSGTGGERGINMLFNAARPEAFHDSSTCYRQPRCKPGTRKGILSEILGWVHRGHEKILWLNGAAGYGKSTIIRTIIDTCARKSMLGASFFFSYDDRGRNTPKHFAASIAFQMVKKMPHERAKIGKILEEDPSILHKPLAVQLRTLVYPLLVDKSSNEATIVIAIDGLDECGGDDDQRDMIRCIEELANVSKVPLRVILSSRVEPAIEESFRNQSLIRKICLNDPRHIRGANQDIHRYLRDALDEIYSKYSLSQNDLWPNDHILSELVERSGGSFLFASVIVRYVGDDDFHPIQRLSEILNSPPGVTPLVELDRLYQRILRACPDRKNLLRVLSVVACQLSDDLSVRDIELLLQLHEGAVGIVLRRMRSVLYVDGDNKIRFHHKHFRDFLHDEERAGNFFIGKEQGTASIAQELLKFLKRDVRIFTPKEEARHLTMVAKEWWLTYCTFFEGCDNHIQLLKEIDQTLKSRHSLVFNTDLNDVVKLWEWLEDLNPQSIRSDELLKLRRSLYKNLWNFFLDAIIRSRLFSVTITDIEGSGKLIAVCGQTDILNILWKSPLGSLLRKLTRDSGRREHHNLRIIYWNHGEITRSLRIPSPRYTFASKPSIYHKPIGKFTIFLKCTPPGGGRSIPRRCLDVPKRVPRINSCEIPPCIHDTSPVFKGGTYLRPSFRFHQFNMALFLVFFLFYRHFSQVRAWGRGD